MGLLRKLGRAVEGGVNRRAESLLGHDPTEVGELRAMGGVRGFFKEVHSAAKEGRDFGEPSKKDTPPWGPSSGHKALSSQQFPESPPWGESERPPW